MMSRPLFVAFLFFAAALLAPPARADVLVLANGDRITGELIEQEHGSIHFRSPLLGLIVAPAGGAVVEHGEPVATQIDLQLAATAAADARALEMTQPRVDAVAHAEARRDDHGSAPADESPRSPWRRVVEFGFTNQTGRLDATDVSLRAQIERITVANELRLQSHYLYSRTGGQRMTDRFGASMRVRHNLSDRVFTQSESRYDHNALTAVDHDVAQSIGIGRNFTQHEAFSFAVGAGAAARYREDGLFSAQPWTYLVDAFQDLTYAINSHLKLAQDLSVRLAPFDAADYMFKLNTAFLTRITNTLNMSMRYELEYDHSLVPEARETQRVVTSMAYAF